ncbi:MAG: hypothetical protein AAGF11_48130 [Myxococcota bacterium]
MSAPANRQDSHRVLVLALVAFIVLVVLPVAAPVTAIVLGALLVAASLTYFASPRARAVLDRITAGLRLTRIKRYLAVTGIALLGASSTTLGAAVLRSIADVRMKRQDVMRQAVEREITKATQIEQSLAQFDQAMSQGDLAAAADALDAAVELDDAHPDVLTRKRALRDAVRDRQLARLPDLLQDIERQSKTADWEAALETCKQAKQIDPEFDGLKSACAAARKEQRRTQFPQFVEAASRVAADDDLCDTPLELKNAWENLRTIPPGDENFRGAKKAARGLERCRKRVKREFVEAVDSVMQLQRETWASDYQTSLLDEGMDVRVSLRGKRKTKIKIRYALLNRAGVHQITKDGSFLNNLQKIGFERVTFSDGFYESWFYDLEPDDVEHAVTAKTLKPMNLHQRLEL